MAISHDVSPDGPDLLAFISRSGFARLQVLQCTCIESESSAGM